MTFSLPNSALSSGELNFGLWVGGFRIDDLLWSFDDFSWGDLLNYLLKREYFYVYFSGLLEAIVFLIFIDFANRT